MLFTKKDEHVHGYYEGEIFTFCGVDVSKWEKSSCDETETINCPECVTFPSARIHNITKTEKSSPESK